VSALASAFGLVFLAELGDKSMLLALTFATRYPWWWVLAGIALDALLLMAIAVAAGGALDAVLPDAAVGLGSGVLFIGFGVWALLSRDEDEEEMSEVERRSALVTIGALALAFGLAELGDKTQVAALSLGGMNPDDKLGVWFGASVGMVAANALAIGAGTRLVRLTSRARIARVAGMLFIAFGVGAIALTVL
jgi:putative Ca2+/H+ antiporter (TMEM165/GDT1 family)